jgi:hypothetical protein
MGGSAVAGPPFSFLCGVFFLARWICDFAGVLQKSGVFKWCFGGENVVNCMVNVVRCRRLFERLKK